MTDKKCFWHKVVEPATDKSYKQCRTCGHVFDTEADFRREVFCLETPEYDDNGKAIEGFSKPTWPEGIKLEDVLWCPFCGADFDD